MTTDIPAGYKLTEVGVIPGDWDVVALGDLGLCLIGLNYKPSNVKQHGTLVLRSSNVQDGVIALDDCVYVDAEIPERIRVQDGDILICVRNGSRALIGKCTVLDQRVVGQTFGAFMSVFRTSDSAFIFQQFNSNLIKRQINENIGATINQITNANLNAFLVPLPRDQGDRNAIATALSDVDALLARLDALIAKKRDLKQAAMQQLLTGQTRLPGFSSAWEMKQFSEICHMKSGEGITCADIDDHSKFPCYGGNGLRGYTARYTHAGSYALIGRQGALCGNVQSVNGEFFASEHAIVLTPLNETDIHWLAAILKRMNLNQYSESSAQPGLSVSRLLAFSLDVPPFEEQTAIATILSDMDAELAALQTRRDKTHALKQGMMQALLTGRIRLVPTTPQP
ncbi:MAG: hypothetical protein CO065_09500 [Comamonadaceae bacterium CG_4_9_14_0_8_um_filter_57_21]|nr:MAG: hypothetical protein COY49_03300 [Comamonadaceae bacterium CG_4_10_14_0_8_um_filter_57_29]PJC17768.1 MAG: hypothetical protein CO065_09500 [Comamonadaceae bacterium CG_4_9_14_0_8_um_filter_57_21]